MTNDAKDNIKAQTIKIMRDRVNKVEQIIWEKNVDLKTACKLASIRYSGYVRDKKKLCEEVTPKMSTTIESHHESSIIDDLPEPRPQKMHRISIDIPDDVYKYIAKETKRSRVPLKIKTVSQIVLIDAVRDKAEKGEPLIKF